VSAVAELLIKFATAIAKVLKLYLYFISYCIYVFFVLSALSCG